MNKDVLLKSIAETAYNVGYGAKVNFATLDIIEKLPGFLSFVGLVVGIYALFVPELTSNQVGAAMVLLGIAGLYLGMYQPDRDRYEAAGKALTAQFYELKNLYNTAKSRPDTADFTDLVQGHSSIQSALVNVSVSKQVLFSDWYAHYKFFWQQQIEWIDEQKSFGLFRDKVPLTAWFAAGFVCLLFIYHFASKLSIFSCLVK
ncbi:SLATT domain-containing protein [Cupriavidus neocaledonicus]|uniref:SMODS and SLOG-associating 2TM effector domain-containing protein n=1 Tax=Cupriavidus neocaledonicus TaxID=1040979 RepID=A0ABY1V0K1_9BURK|nr:SLATT domain-containing protein [Cupriavidus neocaledonicus]SOZ36225.1 conserved membrane hypothetical protein [Cupriavidus neocaledonicus]